MGDETAVRTRLGAVAVACATVLGPALTGCSQHRDGSSVAEERADEQAARVQNSISYIQRIRDAEHIAAGLVRDEQSDNRGTVRLEVLDWSGRTFGDEQATIDVRIVVTVVESGGFGGGHSAGEAAWCYRYTLQLYRYTTHDSIDCSPGTARVPVAKPVPALPIDAQERLTKALTTATPDTLEAVVRAAFPEPYVVVHTLAHQGTLVATAGVPAERDCVVMIRTPAGEVQSIGFDRVAIEPGEAGCTTDLYVVLPK